MSEDKIGGAILGFFGAIKICHREGYDPRDVFEMMNDGERLKEIIGKNPYAEFAIGTESRSGRQDRMLDVPKPEVGNGSPDARSVD